MLGYSWVTTYVAVAWRVVLVGTVHVRGGNNEPTVTENY